MSYRAVRVLVAIWRALAVLVALLTPVLVIAGVQIAEIAAQTARDYGMTPTPFNAAPVLVGGILCALVLWTVGEGLALLADMAIAQHETADALARIRRR